MKKLFMFLLITTNICAEMRFDPVKKRLYSYPDTGINEDEYGVLLCGCFQTASRLKALNRTIPDIINRCISYLKPIKRPAARRLIEDLKQNKIYYSDGTFMKKIFSE